MSKKKSLENKMKLENKNSKKWLRRNKKSPSLLSSLKLSLRNPSQKLKKVIKKKMVQQKEKSCLIKAMGLRLILIFGLRHYTRLLLRFL
jgi:hypothetical protein